MHTPSIVSWTSAGGLMKVRISMMSALFRESSAATADCSAGSTAACTETNTNPLRLTPSPGCANQETPW